MSQRPDQPWDKLAASLREAGAARRPDGEDLSPPPAFATRVVARARADQRADSAGLALWRRWALGGACAAIALFGAARLVSSPAPAPRQFVPVPLFEATEIPDLTSE